MKSARHLWNVWFISLLLIAVGLIVLVVCLMEQRRDRIAVESKSKALIQTIEDMLESESEKVAFAKWVFMTNYTEKSRSEYEYTLFNYDKLVREIKLNMTALPWETFRTSKLRRKFFLFLHSPRVSLLHPTRTAELSAIKANINSIQMKKVWAPEESTNWTSSSKSPADRLEVDKNKWKEFNDRLGKEIKTLHRDYVKLMNENAELNDFPNAVNFWVTSDYEMEPSEMNKTVFKLWEQMKPLYQQLHGYIVNQLRSRPLKLALDGLIPVQLFETSEEGVANGEWTALYKTMKPFPKKPDLNITAELNELGYSPQTMAMMSEGFFNTSDFPKVTPGFWSESIFSSSPRTRMDCHPTLYKISNNEKELRISLCGTKNEQTFRTINKLMTRAKLILLRKDQPFLFRHETNSVMAVAAEEAVQMFMESTNRLKNLGLLRKDSVDDDDTRINSLFQEALSILPRMAHSLAFHEWNSNVFGKTIESNDYNCNWWANRQKIEGVVPPFVRTRFNFDPARSKFLVAYPSSPLRSFVVPILRFQLFTRLREAAEEEESQDMNVISDYSYHVDSQEEIESNKSLSLNGKASGLLTAILNIGSSKPWQSVLEEVASETELNAKPLLDYFEPLFQFLQQKNQQKGVIVDWYRPDRIVMCSK